MLKLKRFDKPKWFEMPGYPGVKLLIRASSFHDTTKILSAVKRKMKVGDDVVDDYDDGVFALEIFKRSLVDFEGVTIDADDGEPLSKDEQKEILYDYDVFRDFVAEKSRELNKKLNEELDGEVKNSKPLQGG